MNLPTRGLVAALFCLALVGLPACSEDNEAEATKLSKNMGDPGPGKPEAKKADTSNLPAASTPKELYEQRQKANGGMPANYPGAKKK